MEGVRGAGVPGGGAPVRRRRLEARHFDQRLRPVPRHGRQRLRLSTSLPGALTHTHTHTTHPHPHPHTKKLRGAKLRGRPVDDRPWTFGCGAQVTGEPVHLHRAVQFGRIIAEAPAHEFRTPDTPSSLYEGSAGPVLYLFDLLRPQTASFPGYQF